MESGSQRSIAARWLAIIAVGALGVAVTTLAVLAYDRVHSGPPPSTAGPVPTFTFGAQTQTTPAPTPATTQPPAPTPAPVTSGPAPTVEPREVERFLSLGSGAWWRGTAGACGGAQPVIERSVDEGRSWTDVTPRYLGIGQLASLEAFTGTEAEMVAAMGAGCETQALRTFTQGRFWDSYPEVLVTSRYVDIADASVVHLAAEAVGAPCAQPRGIRASGEQVGLICDGAAWLWDGADWNALAPTGAVALMVRETDTVVAHSAPGCDGLTLTSFTAADFAAAEPAAGVVVGCAEGTGTAAPVALALADNGVVVWAEDMLTMAGLSSPYLPLHIARRVDRGRGTRDAWETGCRCCQARTLNPNELERPCSPPFAGQSPV